MRASPAKRIDQLSAAVSAHHARGVFESVRHPPRRVASSAEDVEEPEMSYALLIPVAAVATGVVVIVVAIAVVLVVMLVTLSMRGRQRRSGKDRQALADAQERAARAERDRDIAEEQARRSDPDS